MTHDFIGSLIGTVLLVAIPTAIVYWRNRGRLSISKSYHRGLLHMFRVIGWCTVVFGVILTAVTVAAQFGARIGDYPWWSVFLSLGFVGIGYGVQRVARAVLNDAEARNMFWSADR